MAYFVVYIVKGKEDGITILKGLYSAQGYDMISDKKLMVSSREKLQKLYEMYSKAMLAAALAITHNIHDAEDAVQQACVSFIEVIDKINIDEERMCRSYVILVCERKALDIIKRRNNRKEVPLEEEMCGLDFDFDLGSTTDKAMSNLKARDREALLVRYAMSENINDTAEMLGVSIGACYKLIERAKVKLKEELRRIEREEK